MLEVMVQATGNILGKLRLMRLAKGEQVFQRSETLKKHWTQFREGVKLVELPDESEEETSSGSSCSSPPSPRPRARRRGLRGDYRNRGHMLHSWPWESSILERVSEKTTFRPAIMKELMEIIRESRDEWWEECEAAYDRRAALKRKWVRITKCKRCRQPLSSDVEPVTKRQKADSAGGHEKDANGKK